LAVSPTNGTLHDIISQFGGGIAVDVGSPNAVAQALHNFHAEWKKGTLDEKYGSYRLFSLFSENRVLEQYMEIFRRIKKMDKADIEYQTKHTQYKE
jgi:hypothetical protein